jgi:hypothetical protein
MPVFIFNDFRKWVFLDHPQQQQQNNGTNEGGDHIAQERKFASESVSAKQTNSL